MSWMLASAMLDLERGDFVVWRSRRRWWQFWRPKIEMVRATITEGPVQEVTAIWVDHQRVL